MAGCAAFMLGEVAWRLAVGTRPQLGASKNVVKSDASNSKPSSSH